MEIHSSSLAYIPASQKTTTGSNSPSNAVTAPAAQPGTDIDDTSPVTDYDNDLATQSKSIPNPPKNIRTLQALNTYLEIDSPLNSGSKSNRNRIDFFV